MKKFSVKFNLKKYMIKSLSLLSILVFGSSLVYGQQQNKNQSIPMNYNEMITTQILGSSTRLCTGISIGKSAVLTTADCVLGNDVPILIRPNIGLKNYKKTLPEKVYIHPLYDSNKNKYQYNLAVVIYPEYVANIPSTGDTPPALNSFEFYKVKLFSTPLFQNPYATLSNTESIKDHSIPLYINTYSIDKKNYNNPDSYFSYNKIEVPANTNSISPINEYSFDTSSIVANSSVFKRDIFCGLDPKDNSLKYCAHQPMHPNLNQGSGLFYNNELIATYSGSKYKIVETNNLTNVKTVQITEYWNAIVNSDTYDFLKEVVEDLQ